MNVKTDTKEKFTVLTPQAADLSVIMTEELVKTLHTYLQKDIPHVVLNLQEVAKLEAESGSLLAQCQQQFYEQNASLVICCLQPGVEADLDRQELLELLNVTPTESEAWDIVQMEEIERELLNGEDES